LTLNNLGCICERQNRIPQAEQFYRRALTAAESAPTAGPLSDDLKSLLAYAQKHLNDLHSDNSTHLLNAKSAEAHRKYEDALVKFQNGDPDALRLYREAIAIWEELLPQATNPEYRKDVVARLTVAFIRVAECQPPTQRGDAQAALKKAISYGEQSVTLEPDRPLPKHNLEIARAQLEELSEAALYDEIAKLCQAEQFAAAIELFRSKIDEDEQRVRSNAGQASAVPRLAYRLDRFAWFLAHCPDERVRDPKAAVRHARRATNLQPDVGNFWYTLAVVHYRNDEWQDSLAALDKVKTLERGWDASSWFFSAMNLHQLKRLAEARNSLKKGLEWFDEKRRAAEDNPVLRYQFELMRPGIERLRREAENLIDGKNPNDRGIG
jgi:tetratricopeptide (TPR) repeat protein